MKRRLEDAERLIEELKDAIVAREERINALELALLKARAGETETPPGPQPLGRLHDWLTDRCQGLYGDGWTAPLAVLAFSREAESRRLRLVFFLPPSEGLAEKPLTILPSFGEARGLTVRRGAPTEFVIETPALGGEGLELRLNADHPEPPAPTDPRPLGIVIVRVEAEALPSGRLA